MRSTTVDLAVTKTVAVVRVPIGDQARFTIGVKKQRAITGDGVTLDDLLPTTLMYDEGA